MIITVLNMFKKEIIAPGGQEMYSWSGWFFLRLSAWRWLQQAELSPAADVIVPGSGERGEGVLSHHNFPDSEFVNGELWEVSKSCWEAARRIGEVKVFFVTFGRVVARWSGLSMVAAQRAREAQLLIKLTVDRVEWGEEASICFLCFSWFVAFFHRGEVAQCVT